MTTIKVNGKTITIANKSSEALSLDTLSKDSIELDNMSKAIESQINAFNIVSNIKAMESIGYKSTEGLGEKLKAGASKVWEKIKEFFKNIVEYIKKVAAFISNININIRFKKLNKLIKDYKYSNELIIKKYIEVILDNQYSELGSKFKKIMVAQTLFGDAFDKQFEPIEEASFEVQYAMKQAAEHFTDSLKKSTISKGFRDACEKIRKTNNNIKNILDSDKHFKTMYFYNEKSILILAISENKVNIIDKNVSDRINEIKSVSENVSKNIDIISDKMNQIDTDTYFDETTKNHMNNLIGELNNLGSYSLKMIDCLNQIKPTIIQFYKYLEEFLKLNQSQSV